MVCKKCGFNCEDDAMVCPNCQAELEKPVAQESTEQPAPVAEDVTAEPVTAESAAEVPAEGAAPEVVAPAPKKKIFKKWWFWVIIGVVVLAVIGAAVGIIIGVTSDSGSDDGGSVGSTYVNPYVTIVKTTKNSNYGITYGAAFDSFFTNPQWSYFQATSGEHVVEFEGGFYYDGAPATATVQFVVDTTAGTLEVYHLSINGVSQSRLVLSALVKKVFESY